MTLFEQSSNQPYHDYIFPIIKFERIDENNLKVLEFMGTGFLVGENGYGLTAYHVIKDFNDKYAKNKNSGIDNDEILMAMFITSEGKWIVLFIDEIEDHPTEDIGLIHVYNPDYKWKKHFIISEKRQFGWVDYFLGGYPADVVYEKMTDTDDGKKNYPKPDLVSIKGYVRRHFSDNLEIKGIIGTHFYELSDIAGKGCSGSPVFDTKNIQEVFGIYSAEKQIFKGEVGEQFVSMAVSYAVRTESIHDWKPELLLGKTIREESLGN